MADRGSAETQLAALDPFAVQAIRALEIAPRPAGSLDVRVLDELTRAGLARVEDSIVHLHDSGYQALESERRQRELARPDRHACRCGAPIARFETSCMRCVVRGHLIRN